MSRIPKTKKLINTRIANGYGGWIYCNSCNETIGYLCYVTYDSFRLTYKCKCGECGSIYITFDETGDTKNSYVEPVIIKNRRCCPYDHSPLFTVIEKKLQKYQYEVVCSGCGTKYEKEKTI